MAKQREDAEEVESEGGQEDTQPEVQVVEKDGQQVAESTGESRAEKRRRQRMEETSGIIDGKLKPVMESLQQLLRQPHPQQQQFQQPVQQQAAPKDDSREEIRKLTKRQEEIFRSMSNAAKIGLTEKDMAALQEEWNDLDVQKIDVRAKHLVTQRFGEFERTRPVPEPPEWTIIKSEFPDVIAAGPSAMEFAGGIFRQEKARAARQGKPFDEMAAHRKALSQTAVEFGIRQTTSARPSPSQQARFAGAGPTGGGNGGGGFSRQLSKEERAMAIHSAPKGTPEKEAIERWIKLGDPDYFKSE